LRIGANTKGKKMSLPPWTYRIFDPVPKTATVCVRLLASELPSQGAGVESIEALVEVPWDAGKSASQIQQDALRKLEQ
jgi:hypothetical protein